MASALRAAERGTMPVILTQRYADARVADVVEGCSDSLSGDPNGKAPYVERKTKHIEHLRTASEDVLLVTAADKLHNARAIHADLLINGTSMLKRFNGTGGDRFFGTTTRSSRSSRPVPQPKALLGCWPTRWGTLESSCEYVNGNR